MTKEECEIETSKAIMKMRKHIAELTEENDRLNKMFTLAKEVIKQFLNDYVVSNDVLDKLEPLIKEIKKMSKEELEKEEEKIDKMKGIGETDKKFLKNLLHDKRTCENCKKIRPCEQEEKAKGKFIIMACKEFVDD